MIYTIGNFDSYKRTYLLYGEIIKTGRRPRGSGFPEGYPGGYAFPTLSHALGRIKEAYPNEGFVPFAMKADWNKNTYPTESGWWHHLKLDAEIVWPPYLTRGLQILYVPDENSENVERGFVTSQKGELVFCRFWHKETTELRTKSTSEPSSLYNLTVQNTVSEAKVRLALDKYC